MGKIKPIAEQIRSKSVTDTIKLSCIFLMYQSKSDEVVEPVFRIRNLQDILFVDINHRVYSDWNDFETSNKLPGCLYIHPLGGEYNKNKGLRITFSWSPASYTSQKVVGVLDVVGKVVTVGSAAVLGVAAALHALPMVAVGGTLAAVASGAYGINRGISKITDKVSHEQRVDQHDVINVLSNVLAVATGGTAPALVAARSSALYTHSAIQGLAAVTSLVPEDPSDVAPVSGELPLKTLLLFNTKSSRHAIAKIRKIYNLTSDKSNLFAIKAFVLANSVESTHMGGIQKYISKSLTSLVMVLFDIAKERKTDNLSDTMIMKDIDLCEFPSLDLAFTEASDRERAEFFKLLMDSVFKNTCPECKKVFCCSAHRADHEVKNHPEIHPKLNQDFIVQLFQKRAENILLKSQNRKVSKESCVLKEADDNLINENITNGFIPRNPRKRTHNGINKITLSSSVTVSETRKILVPAHRNPENPQSKFKNQINPYYQPQAFVMPHKTSLYNSSVKTSTPILENLSKEKTPTGNWDYISPASSISYYGTPHLPADGESESQPLFRPPSNKSSITPLRSIMAKASKYAPDSDGDRSLNFNFSKGRRVTFSFSSSKVSSTNSSPLEAVQEIEIHEGIQGEKREFITSVSSGREVSTGFLSGKTYEFEVTSTVNSSIKTSQVCGENITNFQRFNEDSLASVKGGLFSCVTSMFCSAVHTFPLWKGLESRTKRYRSPERGAEPPVVHSPLPKRPCYPSDLRLNPIRARKPISQAHS